MISPQHAHTMARYNRWQNHSLTNAASALSDEARRLDRGAFFGSIARTFNHLLWDDRLWLARFGGEPKPERSIRPELETPAIWDEFLALRLALDAEIIAWADMLDHSALSGETVWHPDGGDFEMRKPTWLCITHFFNHQTHHRGQIHAMITSAGGTPEPTDLPMLD